MTNEEAHKILCRNILPCLIGEWKEAISIAATALESGMSWIPCSEKPYPDTDGIYLITVRIGDSVFVEVSHFLNIDGSVWWVDHDYNFGEVIAWMPAMEPYKEVME